MITPNPFTSGGAQWNLMAAYGAQLEQGKTEDEAIEYLARAAREHAGSGQERARGAADVLGRQGRRPARVRERGDLRPERRASRSSTSFPIETILIENPAAVTVDAAPAAAGAGSSSSSRRRPSGSSARRATGRSTRTWRPSSTSRSRRASSRSPTSAAGRTSAREFFDRENGIVAGIEQELGVPTDD